MIEKREKNLLNVQNPADNVTTDISSGSHKNDGPLNGDNAEIATNFTEITRFNGKSENEYIIMMSKESFERNNGPADIYIDADTHSTTNYGRNENTDEAASCIETSNFSLDDVQAEIQVGTFEVTFSRPVIGQLRPMKSFDWLILDLKHSQIQLQQENERSSQDGDDRESVLTTKHASTSQDPIEIRDNPSSHADECEERNNTDDDTDTVRDNMARNDDADFGTGFSEFFITSCNIASATAVLLNDNSKLINGD